MITDSKATKQNLWSNSEVFGSHMKTRSPHWAAHRHGIAQAFLDRFTRKNIAEIDEIPAEEHAIMVRESTGGNDRRKEEGRREKRKGGGGEKEG